jgi:2-dehydro-3-deoxyphosphogalactonate aldolase
MPLKSTVNNVSSPAFMKSRRGSDVSAKELLRRYLDECPLVAIIRGVRPDEAEAIGDAIYEGGIRIIEVPLNSPDALKSIERLAAKFGDRALVGAGTVLDRADVERVRDAGGRIIVSPDTNIAVIEAAAAAGLVASPGYFTPSEAFAAIRAGATALKLFPAEGATPALLKAQLAVLPNDLPVMAVGGIKPDNMRPWLDAGATGFGLGGGLYKSGQSAAETLEKARAYVAGMK